MIHKDYEYVHGSAAKQLKYDVYESNKVLKEKKRYKSNRKIKLKLVLSILSVLLAGLAVMYRYAVITQLSYDIDQKEKVYNELRNENSILKVLIETKTDLAEIKEFAETHLSMQKPDKSQIVHIKVPRNDYTLVMNADYETEPDDGNILMIFLNKVAGLIRLFE